MSEQHVLVPIVEGHAEVQSVPVLLRRLLADRHRSDVRIARPVRVGRYKIVRPGELERAIALAQRRPEGCHALLVLLDADNDCPKIVAPDLLRRAQDASAGRPAAMVFAKSEFEAWFLGSLESLRGVRGIIATATAPERPEEIRGAKERLTEYMAGGRRYVDVDDQPALVTAFDLNQARQRCPSFDKLVRDVDDLLARLSSALTEETLTRPDAPHSTKIGQEDLPLPIRETP